MENKYKKLLADYFNKNSEITREIVTVKSYSDCGENIEVNIKWEDDESINESNLSISIFDLLAFVYSKL